MQARIWGMGPRYPYAFLCTDCNHMASGHRLAEDGDLREGAYRCLNCSCEQPQDGAIVPLTRRQYEAWKRSAA